MQKRNFMQKIIGKAISNQEIKVYIQPQYDVQRDIIVGGEALVRWKWQQEEMMRPERFIPILEKYEVVECIDFWVFEEVCKLLIRWQDKGLKIVPISVNFSLGSLRYGRQLTRLKDLIKKYRINKEWIVIELTETMVCKNRRVIHELKKEGIKLAMDDFGKGYSSLSILEKVEVDSVKIDKEFVKKIESSDNSRYIFLAIVQMLRKLEKEIIVEGVENREELKFVKQVGCRYIQGYLVGKPMCVQRFEKLLYEYKGIGS